MTWEELLERGFRAAGQTEATARDQKKSEQWKIWVAAEMKCRTLVEATLLSLYWGSTMSKR